MYRLILLLAAISSLAENQSKPPAATAKPSKAAPASPTPVKPDLLFPKSGLLLVKVSGFIESGKHQILVHFTDGISHYDHHENSNCGSLESNVNLGNIRSYFTRYIGQQLDHGGYNYTVDSGALRHLNVTDPFHASSDVTNKRREAQTFPVETTLPPITFRNEESAFESNEYDSIESTEVPATIADSFSTLQAPSDPDIEIVSKLRGNRNANETMDYISGSIEHLLQDSSIDFRLNCEGISQQNRTCTHVGHVPRTVYDIALPSRDDVQIFTLKFTNYTMFDGSSDVHQEQNGIAISYHDANNTNVFTLMVASSGGMSAKNVNGRFVDRDDGHTFVYLPFSGDVTHLKFTYSVNDITCGQCLFQTTTTITILDMFPKVPNRRRRSWFFGLQTKYEVDNELRKALQITKNWRSLSRAELDNVANLIKQNDLAITRNSDSLSKLYDQFCQLQSVNLDDIARVAYRSQIMDSASRLLDVVHQCGHGNLPDALDFSSIYSICLVHLDRNICDRLGHKIRDIMTCSNKGIRLTDQKYLVTLQISVPKAMNLSTYDIYSPITVPVFDGQFQHRISSLEGNHVMKYAGSNSIVILNDCYTIGSTYICNPSQSPDDKTSNCVSGILMNDTQPCFTESYRSSEVCFTRSFEHGILVSTKRELEVHVSDPDGLFRSKAKTVMGVEVIPNSADCTMTISCNGLLASTKMTEKIPVDIYDNHEWILKDTLTPVVNRELHFKIEDDKRKSQETLVDIMSNLSTINEDHNLHWIDNAPSLDSPHGQSSLAIYLILSITTFVILVIAVVFARKYCCNPNNRQVQIVSATNPAFLQQSTPFITTST